MVDYKESRPSLRIGDDQSIPSTESLPITQHDCFEAMSKLRIKYPRNIIIGYININSIRNKFNNFVGVVSSKVDIIVSAETNLDSSFPNCQFMITALGSLSDYTYRQLVVVYWYILRMQ